MVGCGNSAMSEDMAKDGYEHITNMDVSGVVLDKMRETYPRFEYICLDGTSMPFRSDSFDVCVDKGTFDALACGADKTVICKLTQEMLRVARESVCIITSGTPEKRLPYFEEFIGGQYERIEHFEIDMSSMSHLINLMRSELRDKPLSYAIKEDPRIFKRAMEEL